MIHVTLWTLTSNLLLTLMEKGKIWHHAKRSNFLSFQFFKIEDKLHFITLIYTLDYTLHPKLWIFVQVNSKLNIGGAKCNIGHSLGYRTYICKV